MLTLIAALIILKGAEGFKAIGKIILCMIALIIDTFIILSLFRNMSLESEIVGGVLKTAKMISHSSP